MSKKKKISKEIQEKRRLVEAEKARLKSRTGVVYATQADTTVDKTIKASTFASDKYSLPVPAIKKDMLKNGLYMVFVVVVLAVLKITGVTF